MFSVGSGLCIIQLLLPDAKVPSVFLCLSVIEVPPFPLSALVSLPDRCPHTWVVSSFCHPLQPEGLLLRIPVPREAP